MRYMRHQESPELHTHCQEELSTKAFIIKDSRERENSYLLQ